MKIPLPKYGSPAVLLITEFTKPLNANLSDDGFSLIDLLNLFNQGPVVQN